MDYARRIYGFAYWKTRDTREAEDLSQEILLALLSARTEGIRNMDAYVAGVCRHVWARYLRRNKPHWEATRYESALDFLSDERGAEEEIESRAEYEEVRREIAYLSRTRREALVMRYFEGKPDAEIAKALGISPTTVRWHLYKARDELKGRLNMETRNGMRAPVRLAVGHSGNTEDYTMRGLTDDLLTQNIAWACYGKPLRAEEAARELGVPAVYVEDKLESLVGMDYMKKIGDRYQTGFFIHTPEYLLASARYNYVHTPPLAQAYFRAAKDVLPDIRAIGFVGCDLPETELLWHVLPELIMRSYSPLTERLHAALNLRHRAPLRPDGTRHWVAARLDPPPKSGDPVLDDFIENGVSHGIKSRGWEGLESMQYDFHLLGPWREFNGPELGKARLAAQVARGRVADERDREALAALARDGYAEGGKLMIPYMTEAERRTYDECLDRAISKLDMDALYAPFEGYAHEMERLIPTFIDSNERAHRLTSYDPFNASIYLLVKANQLALPEPNISRRLCTVVWENMR